MRHEDFLQRLANGIEKSRIRIKIGKGGGPIGHVVRRAGVW